MVRGRTGGRLRGAFGREEERNEGDGRMWKREVRSTGARISRSIWIITCTTTCQIIQSRGRTQRPAELAHTRAAIACMRACMRTYVRTYVACRVARSLPCRHRRWTGGSFGGWYEGETCVRGGGDSLQQFYNCPNWISCRLVERDSRNTVAFRRRGSESIFKPPAIQPLSSSPTVPPRLLPSQGRRFLGGLFIFRSLIIPRMPIKEEIPFINKQINN